MSISSVRAKRLAELQRAKEGRAMEALRLYRPLPEQERFHRSKASERIVRGGNQSGKSASGFMEVASAACGMPITSMDGKPLPYQYRVKDRSQLEFLIWCIGYGEDHLGDTVYRMLFTESNGLQIIRDEHTKKWRSFQPWNHYDKAYEEKARPMPPYIPPRMIKETAWLYRSRNVFHSVILHNGTKIRAFTSRGEAKQGDQVDVIDIDEDIEREKHVSEWLARLSKRKGRLIWQAFPHDNNRALRDMSRRAKEQRDWDAPDVEEFLLTFSGNPFMPEDEKRKRLAAWAKMGCLEARDQGLYGSKQLMYPEWNPGVHGSPKSEQQQDDKIDEILRQNNGHPPKDWTRYLVVDPGHTRGAVLFAAVPPPKLGEYVVLYDEIVKSGASAEDFAKLIRPKVAGGPIFEAFLIDKRAGRQTQIGAGRTISQWFRRAFEKYGIYSARSGYSLIPASDDVQRRTTAVRQDFLAVRDDGTTKLKVYLPRMKNFIDDIEIYAKRVVKDEATDEPITRAPIDLAVCLEYLAAFNPQYVFPRDPKVEILNRERRNRQDTPVDMGPASGYSYRPER